MVTLAQARTQINDGPKVFPDPNYSEYEVIGLGDGSSTLFYLAHANVVSNSLQIALGSAVVPQDGGAPSLQWAGVPSAAYVQGGSSTDETTGPTQALVTLQAVATTAESAVSATGSQTVTPASMCGVYAGSSLLYDTGDAQETVVVTAVTTSAFTAVFANTHESGVAITGNGAPPTGVSIGARYMATVLSDADLSDYLARAVTTYGGIDDRTVLKAVTYDYFDVLFTNLNALKLYRYGDFTTDTRGLLDAIQKQKESLRLDLEGSPIAGRKLPFFRAGHRRYRQYTPRA